MSRRAHWEDVYDNRPTDQVSWHQDHPTLSLELVQQAGLPRAAVDIGGGASRFAPLLVQQGVSDVLVLDLSAAALARHQAVPGVRTQVADVTAWTPDRHYDLWHDRAAFHFLTDPADRAAYKQALLRALPVGGHAIIATFDLDGPERCSNLPVQRYSTDDLLVELDPRRFVRVDHRREAHRTPAGKVQHFQYSLLRRRA